MNSIDHREPVADWFAGLTADEQVRFLLDLAHELTVAARAYYVPQVQELTDGAAVRTLNEIQHRVTAHARNILDNPAEGTHRVAYGYLDAVPDHAGLPSHVRYAVESVRRRIDHQPVS
jgi:hypothetical protein